MIVEGDKVVTHKTFSQTHRAELLGFSFTARQVEFEFIDVLRILELEISGYWGVLVQIV